MEGSSEVSERRIANFFSKTRSPKSQKKNQIMFDCMALTDAMAGAKINKINVYCGDETTLRYSNDTNYASKKDIFLASVYT